MRVNIFTNLLFFFILFPYLTLFKTPFDLQPYALVAASIFLVIYLSAKRELKLLRAHFAIFHLLLVPSIFFIFSIQDDFLSSLRSYSRYLSLFAFLTAGYFSKKYISFKLYVISVAIWFVFGILEIIYRLNFFPASPASYIISDYRTDNLGRGLTSLAVEPSYYGIMCFYMLILNTYFYKEKYYGKYAYLINSSMLIIQILLSLSGISFILLGIWFIYLLFDNIDKFYKFVKLTLASILVGILLLLTIPADSRIGTIISAISEYGVLEYILLDASISSRIAHIVLSLKGFIDSFPFGNGFNSFERYIGANREIWDSIVRMPWEGSIGNEIMTGIGSVLFEIGIVGLLIIILSIFPILKKNVYSKIAIVSLIPLITSTPISMPIVFYTIGLLSAPRCTEK